MRTLLLLTACSLAAQQPAYDLLLKGGHVIDPKNNISKVMDVAIAGGKIARVDENIPADQAKVVAPVSGLYVTPGLIDIHVHVYTGTALRATATKADSSVQPDAFSFRTGVTTMVDAGTSGWRNFPDFRDGVIRKAKTRVLAMLNIVGAGMGSGSGENNPEDMDPEAAAKMAKENADVVVGFKSAHYAGPGWFSIDNAVKAGNLANVPVMVDFGAITKERNLDGLLRDKLRKGDIYTHCYSGHRLEVLADNKVNPAMEAGRQRGIFFDVGFGQASFYWYVAAPAYEQKFYPDSISTDLHARSMNAGMKDMLQCMSKILNLGSSLEDVIRMSTVNPAREIKRPQLGTLDPGAEADIAVLRLDRGDFGLLDSAGAKYPGNRLLASEMTIRKGEVVWDLNGRAAPDWKNFPYKRRGELR
ncbi:MAG: amidohydrolase/deacetylase family metallohydrolase [Acidobacteria bacterium]|nr:amidohydrolase/deacetylase family metallohydrolase [Acidobacteriota bacterium]